MAWSDLGLLLTFGMAAVSIFHFISQWHWFISICACTQATKVFHMPFHFSTRFVHFRDSYTAAWDSFSLKILELASTCLYSSLAMFLGVPYERYGSFPRGNPTQVLRAISNYQARDMGLIYHMGHKGSITAAPKDYAFITHNRLDDCRQIVTPGEHG